MIYWYQKHVYTNGLNIFDDGSKLQTVHITIKHQMKNITFEQRAYPPDGYGAEVGELPVGNLQEEQRDSAQDQEQYIGNEKCTWKNKQTIEGSKGRNGDVKKFQFRS